ncbi:MAG: OmpA family protein [Bacteroides sp.]|nr:OmpA family protein [Roseburia sp.]MCM1345993.1 OmpA family protein [Bacteroides sp.]MCM1420848.1 OmpA family protein [Bacteroides sp.]
MKNLKFNAAVLSALLLLSGCNASNTTKGGLIGAGGGAAIGALAGRLIGGNGKGTVIGAVAGTAIGTTAGILIGKKMDKAKAAAEAVKNAQVESVTDANGLSAVKVTFDSGILFATNKSDLNAAAKTSLSDFAKVLKTYNDADVAIYGHTDNTGTDAINNPLSEKRAQSVESYLRSCGVAASQIAVVEGKGSTEPVADNSTATGRTQNRRVEVYLYASQAMIEAANAGTLQ